MRLARKQVRFLAVFLFSFFFASPHACAYSRIVTLSPGLAEWTAEILGDVGAKKAVVGVSEYSLYPDFLKSVSSVGPYPQLNIEMIAALHPDLIIASAETTRPEQLSQLERLHLPVKVMPAEKFSGMESWIQALGAILDEGSKAKQASNRWNQELKGLPRFSPLRLKQAFIEIQHEPLITVGGPSFLSEAFARIGYANGLADLQQAYPKVSKESVLSRNPDAIFILQMGEDQKSSMAARETWLKFSDLTAVKNAQIQILSSDDFARCSLRLLKALKSIH